jgi:hypothetical protein
MINRKKWFIAVCIIVFFFLLFIGKSPGVYNGKDDSSFEFHKERTISHHGDWSAGMKAGSTDGILLWESPDDRILNDSRTKEGIAAFSLFFLNDFLLLIFSGLFLGKRPWSVIQFFCMTFQEYSLRNLCIVQSQDGKKRMCSFTV